MKKGGAFLLIAVTLIFVGFVAGILVGRSANREAVTLQTPAETVKQSQSAGETRNLGAQSSDSDKLNINTATAEDLEALPGIGPVLAQRIINYRKTNGHFESIAELSNVEGIGSEKLLAIYDLITVED